MSAGRWSDFKTTDGSTLLFTPPGLHTRKRPCVVLGKFVRGRGDVAIHFRVYHEHSPGILVISRDGITLSLAELDIVVERIKRLLGADAEVAA